MFKDRIVDCGVLQKSVVLALLLSLFLLLSPTDAFVSKMRIRRGTDQNIRVSGYPMGLSEFSSPDEGRKRSEDVRLNVTPREGLNSSAFNFTIVFLKALPTTRRVSLFVEDVGRLNLTFNNTGENRNVLWHETSLLPLEPGTYNYSFLVRNEGEERNYTGNFTIISMVRSFSVSPKEGDLDTLFTFNVTYRHPSGAEPDLVFASIDNRSHFGMSPASSEMNYTTGANYTINSYSMDLKPGIHYYYPVIYLVNRTYVLPNREYRAFWINTTEKKGDSEKEWYEENCCLFPLIFLIMMIIFSVINNLIFRSRKRKKRKTSGLKSGITVRCPNCDSEVPGDGPFCPRCGEVFKEVVRQKEETVCPGCGSAVPEAERCPVCGSSLYERGTSWNKGGERRRGTFIGTRGEEGGPAGEDDGDMLRATSDEVKSGTEESDEGERISLCSVCGSIIRRGQGRCPDCGIELE